MIARALVLTAGLSSAAFWWGTISDPVAVPAKSFEAGQYAQVVSQLSPEALQRLRGDALRRAYFLLGTSLERIGRIDQALGVYQLGVKLYPRDLDLLTQLAALLHSAGLEERAEPLFQKVLSIHPNNEAANLGLAEIDHALGFLDLSAEHYEKALETNEKRPDIWVAYGDVLREMQDHRTAELAYRRSLQLAGTAQAAVGLAFALRAQNRLDEAFRALPESPEFASARSLWLLEAGREAEALETISPSLAASPDDPLGRYIRARARLKQDRFNDAVADLKAAAAGGRKAPFVAKVAAAMLARLQGAR